MGGPVAFAVRFSDGTVRFREVWTGAITEIVSVAFLDDPDVAMRALLDRAKGYAEADTRPMCVRVEDIEGGVYPMGYGLVAVDIPSKRIHTSQNYTTPGAVQLISLGMHAGRMAELLELLRRGFRPKIEFSRGEMTWEAAGLGTEEAAIRERIQATTAAFWRRPPETPEPPEPDIAVQFGSYVFPLPVGFEVVDHRRDHPRAFKRGWRAFAAALDAAGFPRHRKRWDAFVSSH